MDFEQQTRKDGSNCTSRAFIVLPLRPPPGSYFRVERSKDRAIQSFREEVLRWRAANPNLRQLYAGATMPTCFQTLRGRSKSTKEHTDSLFFVHSSPEGALRLRHAEELLRQDEYVFNHQVIPVMQIYELRLPYPIITDRPNNRQAYIIVDWEVKHLGKRGRGQADLEALCAGEEFPLWLRLPEERRHVEPRAVVTAVTGSTRSR